MKKINKTYLATKKDNSIEKIMAELPGNPGDYSAIFTSLEQKLAEKALKALSETDEDAHPAMFIPLSFFFRKPPFEATKRICAAPIHRPTSEQEDAVMPLHWLSVLPPHHLFHSAALPMENIQKPGRFRSISTQDLRVYNA